MIKPLVLMILDGWGHREETKHNAIAQANTPNWDAWWRQYPHALLACSETAVGLPAGQMGNSEVGHMHIGAGRVLNQDYTRINQAVDDGSFVSNSALQAALAQLRGNGSRLHLLGLLSPGGIHSHEQHIFTLIQAAVAAGVSDINVHAILDGRDTPPKSAAASLLALDNLLQQHQCGQIASIIGRYYAMDRDQRWRRTQQAYEMLTQGIAERYTEDAATALEQAYAAGETDEFVKASVTTAAPAKIAAGDVAIFMNFRSDRARQLTQAFTQDHFSDFDRGQKVDCAAFVTLTEYSPEFDVPIMFRRQLPSNTLGECLSQQGLQQLRIAETEKYAHVTYFLNGGMESVFPQEERLLVPSPKVRTYDLQPEMSAAEVTQQLCQAIATDKYDVVIGNYANADMVGHTGNVPATIKAVETLDACLGTLWAAVQQAGGEMLITADHGNADCMYNPVTDQAHTAHTLEPVPFLYLGKSAKLVAEKGSLIDVAPTMLHLLGLPIPEEMSGKTLLKSDHCA